MLWKKRARCQKRQCPKPHLDEAVTQSMFVSLTHLRSPSGSWVHVFLACPRGIVNLEFPIFPPARKDMNSVNLGLGDHQDA